MSKRTPTPEELRLWREINRDTITCQPEESIPEPPPGKPSGEVRAQPQNHNRATPALPQREREKNFRPAQQPHTPLPLREAKRRPNARRAPEASLDLHGYTRQEAYQLTHAFIRRHQERGHRHLVIITGKGRTSEGVLRAELPDWLNGPELRPYIGGIYHADPRNGGEGVLHVLLKKRRPAGTGTV